MKQVILIHAHKDLEQLNALVGQLAHGGFIIYVNVDAKSALEVTRISPQARLVRRAHQAPLAPLVEPARSTPSRLTIPPRPTAQAIRPTPRSPTAQPSTRQSPS